VLTCQHCHAGPADFTFETAAQAHDGMIADPSSFGTSGCVQCHAPDFAENACDGCHSQAVDATRNSLHTNLWGYKDAIEARCTANFDELGVEEGFQANCAGCHTTCGQCHISRPKSVGSGFIQIAGSPYSHRFRPSPDMNEQCIACHGSRIGNDFLGQSEGNVEDTHRQMQCKGCHTMEEIHGDPTHTEENHYNDRYEVTNMPRCEECHGTEAEWDNSYHNAHVDGFASNLQCQVCHSQPYKNCTNCHNLGSGEKSPDKYDIDPSMVQLKIAPNDGGPSGLNNPNRAEYDYVLVRHTPVDPGTFDDWGLSLPNYTAVPTWKYTSPHNIVRWTAQTTVEAGQSCGTSCHGTPDSPEGFFLRESDLYETDGVTRLPDYDANINFVMPDPDKVKSDK
jgi:thiosulfate/3-mercaptopyruvate sulfurtransferase